MFFCRSKAAFNGLEEEDIGIYSCFVTHTDGASSSFTLSEEGRLTLVPVVITSARFSTRIDLVLHPYWPPHLSLSELKRLLKLSHDHKFPSEWFCGFFFIHFCVICWSSWTASVSRLTPLFKLVIPLKSDLAVELLEKGRVRFWLQADKISANGKVDYVFNESSLSQGEVSEWKIREPSVICARIISVFYVFLGRSALFICRNTRWTLTRTLVWLSW